MEHRDALISNVTVVLDERFVPEKVDEIVLALKGMGLEVSDVDAGNGVVDGIVESCKIKSIEALESVDCVRTIFNYVADYPPGDQRDQDGPQVTDPGDCT